MGYQPKYAPQKKKGPSGAAVVLALLLVPLSLVCTGKLLSFLYHTPGEETQAVTEPMKTPDMSISEQIGDFASIQLQNAEAALDGVLHETQPPETEPPRVITPIPADAQMGPKPDSTKYGQVQNPADMESVLKDAAFLLKDDPMYFSTSAELFADTPVRYYLDDSIFAVTWKEAHDKSVYTFSEVKIADPSQLRRHLSDGAFGSGKLYYPTEMAQTVNAVVATSGDFYANRPAFGIMAYEGQVKRTVEVAYAETCYIDDQGDMIFSYMKELPTQKEAQAFLDENNINFSLAFGPILVDNYQVRELPNVYGVGEIREEYARAALCQMAPLHYLVVVANWEGDQPDDPTVERFQKVVAATGCKMAYCLDGGQTATVIMDGELINRPAKGEQRRISDIVYFATAIPEGG